jgi:hypothetical protein
MYRKRLFGIQKACSLILTVIFIVTALSACFTTPSSDSSDSRTNAQTSVSRTNQQTSVRTASASNTPFTGTGGKGIVIAVPTPALRGAGSADSYMPQFFQDIITGSLARFSAMTVLDRLNEKLVLAEQNLSLSGNYSDNDYIRIGNLTNAQFIVAGIIQNISGRYNVSFRINNTETNEIKASFNKPYPITDIESGLAAKEAVRELLAGMGVELTADGERQLLAEQRRETQAKRQLAQGMDSERNGNDIEGLVFYIEALDNDPTMREASARIQNFAEGSPGASIRERANWATTQKEKWEKRFNDLGDYVHNNLRIVVYDFSTISDQFDAKSNRVALTVTPGVKIIPDSTVLNVWKRVLDEWYRIKDLEENKSWANSLSIRSGRDRRNTIGEIKFLVYIELYDEEGIRIGDSRGIPLLMMEPYDRRYEVDFIYDNKLQILPQNRYFSNRPFEAVRFSVPLDKITDNLSVKVVRIGYQMGGNASYPARIMSQSEYDEWVKK